MSNNICPHCEVNLDGELIIDTFIKQGKDYSTALKQASYFSGWEQYGLENRWDNRISIYCIYKDRTVSYRCPDCEKEWSRDD